MGVLLAALFLWFIAGCGSDDAPPAAASKGPLPTVTVKSPAPETARVPVTTVITATFSDDMNRPTITTGTFTVSSPAGPVNGAVSTTAKTATFTPLAALATCSDYTPRLDAGIQDSQGRALTDTVIWTFTTCPVSVRVAPTTATAPKGVLQAFEGIVTGSGRFTRAVLWSVDGGSQNGRVEALDATHGVYVPPNVLPEPSTVTIRAISEADLTSSGTALATVVTGLLLSFGSNVRVTTLQSLVSTWSSGRHSVAVLGSTVYAAWADLRSGGSNWDVYVGRSRDAGQTWSSQRVNDDGGATTQIGPSLALDSLGSVVVTWEDQRNGNADIYLARSTDGGQTFSANVMVNEALGSLAVQRAPSLTLNSVGSVFVAWEDYRFGPSAPTIFLGRSHDGGTSFSLTSLVTQTAGLTSNYQTPSLALHSLGPISIAWTDRRGVAPLISVATTTDGGVLFSLREAVSYSTATQLVPSLGVGGDGTLYLAWEDLRNSTADIFFARSTDAGISFPFLVQANDVTLGSQSGPSLTTGPPGPAGHIYLAWTDLRSGHADIYVAKSLNGGQPFGASVLVNNGLTSVDQTAQTDPSIAVDAAGRAYVIWTDRRDCGSNSLCGNVYFSRGE